ncbi:MAG: ubiquitin-like small modifier protein 1 [Methanomicrobiales archaeon]
MMITIKAFASLRSVMQSEIRLEINPESTITDLLDKLETLYPGLSYELYSEPGVLTPLVNILVNGRNIRHLEDIQTRLEAGDLVAIFPPVAGG